MEAQEEKEPSTRLVLVRHGESNAMVAEVVGGHGGCTGLSPLGVRQAEALRDRLARTGELRADVLMASVLPRAIETAEIIAPAVGATEVVRDCDVCEIHPGESDGLRWAEYIEKYRPDGWMADPHLPMAPGGESPAEFQTRVARTLRRLAQDHRGKTVVVACHGGIVDGSMVELQGLPHHGTVGPSFRTVNTSITEWELKPDDRRKDGPWRWRLWRYNDAAHLTERSL